MKFSAEVAITVTTLLLFSSCLNNENRATTGKDQSNTMQKSIVAQPTQDIAGDWYKIDETGKYHKDAWMNIAHDATIADEYRIVVFGQFVFPGNKSIQGVLKKDSSDQGGFRGALTGVYPDGTKIENGVHLSVVDYSAVDDLTGALTLSDTDSPEWVELGKFQRLK